MNKGSFVLPRQVLELRAPGIFDAATSMTERNLEFEHNGKTYKARLVSRPFREGGEAILVVGEQTITIAELGFGDLALIERLRAELDKLVIT